MKLALEKLEGWGYTVWWKFHNPNCNLFLYDPPVWLWQTDGGTGDSIVRAIACCRA